MIVSRVRSNPWPFGRFGSSYDDLVYHVFVVSPAFLTLVAAFFCRSCAGLRVADAVSGADRTVAFVVVIGREESVGDCCWSWVPWMHAKDWFLHTCATLRRQRPSPPNQQQTCDGRLKWWEVVTTAREKNAGTLLITTENIVKVKFVEFLSSLLSQ